MLTGKMSKLCFGCHSDIQTGMQNGTSTHEPVSQGECTKCHSPHKTKLPKLLLAQSPDMCLSCHKEIEKKINGKNVHPPATGDCLRCHKPHFSSQPSLIATKTLQDLCGSCHNLADQQFSKAHIGINASVMDCASCHDAHGSKYQGLFKDEVHPPFEGGMCDQCHIVLKK